MEHVASCGDAAAGDSTAASIVALPADLIFGARIRSAGESAGVVVATARNPDDLVEKVNRLRPRLVVVDLDLRGDAVGAIAALKGDPATAAIPVLAYVSHVRQDAIVAARAAGADRVLARSAFARDLPSLLRGGTERASPHEGDGLAGAPAE